MLTLRQEGTMVSLTGEWNDVARGNDPEIVLVCNTSGAERAMAEVGYFDADGRELGMDSVLLKLPAAQRMC